MPKSTPDPVVLISAWIPEPRCPVADERDDLVAGITESPAFRQIAEYLEHAKALGFDAGDLDILRRAVAAGEAAHAQYLAVRDADGAWADARSELIEDGVGRHEPVVYYARLGDLVKIGTTTRILDRCESLGVQGVLAVEPGNSVKEHRRHGEFQHLRYSGEWFRQAPGLADHTARVRADFERVAGVTTEAWLDQQRTRRADLRAKNLLKVNRALYSDAATSLPTAGDEETLVTGADAARARGISPQLLNGWREQGKIRQVGVRVDGRPVYRLSDVVRLDIHQRRSPKSNRHR